MRAAEPEGTVGVAHVRVTIGLMELDVDLMSADLALMNGSVWGSGLSGDDAAAVRVRGRRISEIGSDEQVLRDRSTTTRVIDLRGAAVLPAFTDSHTHFHRTAILSEHFLDFTNPRATSVAEVVTAVGNRATQSPMGSWIQGDNLSDSALVEHRFPNRRELDTVAGGHAVVLRGMGKHVVVANSVALDRAGITRYTSDPDGGRIERDDSGDPTGVLHERAKLRLDSTRADTVVPQLSVGDRLRALASGMRKLHEQGIASLHEITRTPDEFADYSRLREAGNLRVRIVCYVRVIEAQASLDDLVSVGVRSGFGDDWLRLGGVKVSIDGSCTFRNAAVYEPYPGHPGNVGLVRIEAAELSDVVRRADAAGLQVAVHAIGQRAVDMALDAFAAVPRPRGARDLRHRIEHAYLMPRPGQLERLRDLGLLLSTQPAFIESLGDTWLEVFDEAQAKGMMPLRTALDLGIRVQANSDCPTASTDPLVGLRSAVLRRTRAGRVLGEAEVVSAAEAVRMFTAAPAYSAFEEDRRGTVEVGKLADLVVLNADPRQVSGDELDELRVEATVVDGEVVYERTT